MLITCDLPFLFWDCLFLSEKDLTISSAFDIFVDVILVIAPKIVNGGLETLSFSSTIFPSQNETLSIPCVILLLSLPNFFLFHILSLSFDE